MNRSKVGGRMRPLTIMSVPPRVSSVGSEPGESVILPSPPPLAVSGRITDGDWVGPTGRFARQRPGDSDPLFAAYQGALLEREVAPCSIPDDRPTQLHQRDP